MSSFTWTNPAIHEVRSIAVSKVERFPKETGKEHSAFDHCSISFRGEQGLAVMEIFAPIDTLQQQLHKAFQGWQKESKDAPLSDG